MCYRFFSLTLLVGISLVPAATIDVAPDGSGDYPTIQAAINAAGDGDIILLTDGTYSGSGNRGVDFKGKAITLQSQNGRDNCIIDCQTKDRGFIFQSQETSTSILSGITIQNGLIEIDPEDNPYPWETPDSYGGAILCEGASPTITNCRMINNQAKAHYSFSFTLNAYGGAVACINNSHPVIWLCLIESNRAVGSAAIGGSLSSYCGGGGVYCDSTSSIMLSDSTVTENLVKGGSWLSEASWPNKPYDSFGGGLYIASQTSSIITNTLIAFNTSVYQTGEDYEGTTENRSRGAGIYCSGHAELRNCSITNNDAHADQGTGGAIYGNTNVIVSNCIVWGNLALSQVTGSCPITYSLIQEGYSGEGNLTTDPLFVAGPLGDYYLSQTASGQNQTSPCVDAGSDTAEALGLAEYFTRTDGIPDIDTVDMGYHYPPFPRPARTVYVAKDGSGDYETISTALVEAKHGDTIIVRPGRYFETVAFNNKNVCLMSTASQDWAVVETTIIDAQGSGRVVTFGGSEKSCCELTGFTLTGGYTVECGGGVYGAGSYATIRQCLIEGNRAEIAGGGLQGCNGAITGCIIRDNTSVVGGGLAGCQGTINNCLVAHNHSAWSSGLNNCDGSILNCTIVDNILTGETDPTSAGALRHCDGNVINCIIWSNTNPIVYEEEATLTVRHSCIQGAWSGEGNIDTDPLFVTGSLGDYYLSQVTSGQDQTSSCVDAGSDIAENLELDTFTTRTDCVADSSVVDMGYHYPVCTYTTNKADFNDDGKVDLADFAEFAQQWLWQTECVIP